MLKPRGTVGYIQGTYQKKKKEKGKYGMVKEMC